MIEIPEDVKIHRLKDPYRLLFGAALITSLFLIMFAIKTIFLPYPIEYREGASQVLTQFLLEARNPFKLSNLPLSMTNYGMAYNLVVLPLAVIFGNTLAIHRVISNLFILLSCTLCFAAIYQANRSAPISLAGTCLIAICLMSYAGNGAFPTSMGTFLFLLAILVPTTSRFDSRSLLTSSLVSILAFYAKPYFILSFGIVLLYLLLFVSIKKAILFTASFAILFSAFAGLILNNFPTYFLETVVSNIANSMLSWLHLIRQFLELVKNFLPCLAFAILIIIHNFANQRWRFGLPRGKLMANVHAWISSDSGNRVYYGFVAICSLLAIIFVLGQHAGTYMSYLYQLLVPPVIIWLFCGFNISKPYHRPLTAALLLNITFLVFTNIWPSAFPQSTEEWDRLNSSVADSRIVFNTPILVSRLIDLGIPVVDSGQSEYFYWIKPYPSIRVAPDFLDVQSRGLGYLDAIEKAIRQKEYEKIYLTQGYSSPLVSPELVSQYYDLSETFHITMPQPRQTWIVQLWLPKN